MRRRWRHVLLATAVAVAALAVRPAGTAVGDEAPVTVVGTIGVGGDPAGIAVDPVAGLVYVTNRARDSVSIVDEHTLRVVATVPVGHAPAGVAADPSTHRAFVANAQDHTLSVVDGVRHRVVATWPVGYLPGAVAVDPSMRRVYVADEGTDPRCAGGCDDIIRALDVRTGQVLAVTDGDLNGWVSAMAVDAATHAIAVSVSGKYQGDALVALLSPALDTLAGNRPGYWVSGVAVDPQTGRLYAGMLMRTLLALDPLPGPAAAFRVARIAIGVGPHQVAVDPSTGTVYVANASGHTVSVVDGRTDRVTATVPVGAPSVAYFSTDNSGPGAIAVDPTTHRIFVADRGGDRVTVLRGIGVVRPTPTPLLPHTGGGGGRSLGGR